MKPDCKLCAYYDTEECESCSVYDNDRECSCHINPPCAYCMDNRYEEASNNKWNYIEVFAEVCVLFSQPHI